MSLITKLPLIEGSYREFANLAKTNWFGVGGNAEILFRPKDINDLCKFLQERPHDINITIIGVGSNLLIRDRGIKGVVIKLGRGFTEIRKEGNIIEVGAGCLNFNLASFCLEYGMSGLEFYIGIPGCIGGALAMNAGAYGSDTSTILEKCEAVDNYGNIHTLSPIDVGFIYRGNTMPDGWIFTKAYFKTTLDDPLKIKERMDKINKKRELTQPIKTRTSGSTFANPEGYSAWRLIDEAGCRGLRVGGAHISEKHCNFIINDKNATASDIENLGEEVRKRVKKKSGIDLTWEIRIIGEK